MFDFVYIFSSFIKKLTILWLAFTKKKKNDKEKEKENKWQYGQKRYKQFPENEKEGLAEYKKSFYEILKNALEWSSDISHFICCR